MRGAAIFFHLDNLNSDLHCNSDFDYLFSHLLQSTQNLLAGYNKLHVDNRTRKVLTLITLGASLHAVQDFYSHSDWIHNDFNKTDVTGHGAYMRPLGSNIGRSTAIQTSGPFR